MAVASRLAGALLAATAVAGCAPASGPTGPLQPLVVGAEQHMTIDWHAEPRGQATVVWGHIFNRSPYTFDHVRVLVDALDPAGQIITQRIVWSLGPLGGWGRNYFETPPMEPAPAYRARIFSYDRIETDGIRRRWPFP